MLNSVKIALKGSGTLQVFGSDLHSGTYIYTIIADGVPTFSYKMIKVD